MTQEGFENYLYTVFDQKNGTAKSYITAIRIIDELFAKNDVFGLGGQSIACISDFELLNRIADFIHSQQTLYKNRETSFFDNINDGQRSYPQKCFCSAAINHLLEYYAYDLEESKASKAREIVDTHSSGRKLSEDLSLLFEVDKEGHDIVTALKVRIGQSYFRKMVLANYGGKCCVTRMNIPQVLRASHIVAWASDKRNRMNPENGLCLSATYDAAFDKHLISFDDDYRMVVSREIKDYYTNDAVKEYFENFEGKQMMLPSYYLPSKKLLERHRELLVG